MKNIFSVLLIIISGLVTFSGQTDKLDQLFQDFEKKGGVTSINIKKPMFKLLNTIDVNDDYLSKLKPILNEVDGVKLLIVPKATFPENLKSENIENIRLNQEKTNRINKALQGLNFNELMSVNNEGTSMKFLAEAEKGDFLENLVFNIDSDDENILFILNGKMKMADVNKIISSTEAKDNTDISLRSHFASEKISSSYINGESRNVGEFSGIDASTGVIVNFKQESPAQVKVIADADKLEYIVTKVEGEVLKIYVDSKGKKNLKFKNISVNVSSPKIDNIRTSSGAIFNAVNNLSGKNFMVDVSSGAVVNGYFDATVSTDVSLSSGASINSQINSQKINIKGSSGSVANLSGKATLGSIDVSSGAVCNAEGLKFDTLEVESTSGAVISGNVEAQLKASASSGGTIKYKGNPKIESKISKISGGSLKQIN